MRKDYVNKLIWSLRVANERLQGGSKFERKYIKEKARKLLEEADGLIELKEIKRIIRECEERDLYSREEALSRIDNLLD